MAEYIDTRINPADYIEVWEVEDAEHGKQLVMAVDDLKYLPPADVRPVAEISDTVDNAIDFLNSVSDQMPYHVYSALHDLICGICPNCGAEIICTDHTKED